jgi:hypothetical protein
MSTLKKLYIVRFGYQRDAAGEATGLKQLDAVQAVERAARLTGVPAFMMRFGMVAFSNNSGAAHVEQGGEVEFSGAGISTEAERFAIVLRRQLQQEAVTMTVQNVETHQFI